MWTNPNNWNTTNVPGPNAMVIINLPGSNVVILNTNIDVQEIDLGGQGTNILEFPGATIQCSGLIAISSNGVMQIDGNSEIDGGSLQNSGTIMAPPDLGADVLTLNCDFANSGIVDAETNSVLTISNFFNGSPQKFLDGTVFSGSGRVLLSPTTVGQGFSCSGTITVNGTLQLELTIIRGAASSTWTGTGLLLFNDSEIDNFTFATNFHAVVSGFEPSFPGGSCTNLGTIYMTNGALEPDGGALYNYGTIQGVGNCGFQSGSTPFPIGSVQNYGTISVPPGLGSNSLTINCNFANYGALAVGTNSELTVSNDVNGSQAYIHGSIFDGAGTIDLAGPSSDNPASLAFNGVLTVNATIVVDQVIISGPSTWEGPGMLRWLGGAFGNVTFAPNFHVIITGSDDKALSGLCTNQGTVEWTNDAGSFGSGPIFDATFVNQGLLMVESDGSWDGIDIQNQSGGTFRQLAGSFSLQSLTNSGTVDLKNGTLNVAGDFFSGSSSTYEVTLGGNTAGSGFNQINAQTLTLNGSLQVTLTNGFSPASGSSLVIASDSSQSGTFSSTSLPALGGGASMDVRYLPTSLILDIVPAFFGLTNAAYTNGSFQFSLNGNPASAYDVQASTNLIDWVTIGTNSPFTGSVNFMDTNAANSNRRFYRARIFP